MARSRRRRRRRGGDEESPTTRAPSHGRRHRATAGLRGGLRGLPCRAGDRTLRAIATSGGCASDGSATVARAGTRPRAPIGDSADDGPLWGDREDTTRGRSSTPTASSTMHSTDWRAWLAPRAIRAHTRRARLLVRSWRPSREFAPGWACAVALKAPVIGGPANPRTGPGVRTAGTATRGPTVRGSEGVTAGRTNVLLSPGPARADRVDI